MGIKEQKPTMAKATTKIKHRFKTMKKRIIFITPVLFFITIFAGSAQTTSTISSKDLKVIKGSWYGSLTYLDYSSNKPYTMPADVYVSQAGKNTFILSHTYPDEPKANSADTIIISGNGKMINEEPVKSIRKPDNGNKEIVTEYLSVDGNDNKPAIIRHTYTVGKSFFSVRKEVQFTGQNEWLKRNEYRYTRNRPGR